jgi:hypothetical protein
MVALTFDTVRTLGLSLRDVVDGTAYGLPALKLGGKLLACMPANKSAEANSIVVCIDLEQRAELLREYPETYYITDHYAPHSHRARPIVEDHANRSEGVAARRLPFRFVLDPKKRR